VSQVGALAPTESRLVRRVMEDSRCAGRLDEARRLSDSLYAKLVGEEYSIVPSLADHNLAHLDRVQRNLDDIIFGFQPSGATYFEPCAAEAMYLLAAARLHDIGMLSGILDGEARGHSADWDAICGTYERRTARFLKERWVDWCEWTYLQKQYLCQICISHRPGYRLTEVPEIVQDDQTGRQVRLRDLAALFRLSEACHANESRASVELKQVLDPTWKPGDPARQWQMPKVVATVTFDAIGKVIIPHCSIPDVEHCGPVDLDFQPIVDLVAEHFQGILDGVSDFLGKYANTDFRKVSPNVQLIGKDMAVAGDYIPSAWPTLLATVSSASEVLGIVAVVLRAVVEKESALPKSEIRRVLERATTLHPYNFLVRQLRLDVENFFQHASSSFAGDGDARQQFVDMLGDRLEKRISAYSAVAQQARRRIGPRDTLVIYGYSRTVMQLLAGHLNGHQGLVIVVPCARNDPELRIQSEDARVREDLSAAGLSFCDVPLHRLPGFLRGAKAPIKFLVGSRGVFDKKEVLSSVGNAAIAAVAKSLGAEVLVLADSEKQRADAIVLSDVRRVLDQEGQRIEAARSDSTSGQCRASYVTIDCLTPEMYDAIIGSEED